MMQRYHTLLYSAIAKQYKKEPRRWHGGADKVGGVRYWITYKTCRADYNSTIN